MPHIIVTADEPSRERERAVMFRERVSCSDFESEHFARHLIERLGWAVGDARELERHAESTGATPAEVLAEPELYGIQA